MKLASTFALREACLSNADCAKPPELPPNPLVKFRLSLLAFFIVAAAFTPMRAADSPASSRPPNIVFILIDDMGWKDISANGSKFYRTPNIDRLAAEGMRFTQAYAACAVCSPSRAAIMSGQSPARLHITDWIPGEGTPKQSRFAVPKWTQRLTVTPILPELLKKQGYTTASIGKWHLGEDGPQAHGFDVNVAGGHIGHPASFFWPYGKQGASHRVPGLGESGGQEGEYLTDRLAEESVKFIKTNKDKPFFLYLAHYAVHSPLMSKDADTNSFKDSPADGKQNFPLYAGMVKSVDDSVGLICNELKALGLEQNTIVVFTSDNGGVEHFRATHNAPLRGGKGFPYEGGLRVPLIIKAPGIAKAGSVSDAKVIGTDFLPTFAKLTGIEGKPAPILDGEDLSGVLRGEKTKRNSIIWHYPHYWGGGLITPYSVLRKGELKLIHWYEYDSYEFYDLAKDPSEEHDLAAENSADFNALKQELTAGLAELGAQLPEPRGDAKPAADPSTNPAHGAKFSGVETKN